MIGYGNDSEAVMLSSRAMHTMFEMSEAMLNQVRNVNIAESTDVKVRLMFRNKLIAEGFHPTIADRIALGIEMDVCDGVFDFPDTLDGILNNYARMMIIIRKKIAETSSGPRIGNDISGWFTSMPDDILIAYAGNMSLVINL